MSIADSQCAVMSPTNLAKVALGRCASDASGAGPKLVSCFAESSCSQAISEGFTLLLDTLVRTCMHVTCLLQGCRAAAFCSKLHLSRQGLGDWHVRYLYCSKTICAAQHSCSHSARSSGLAVSCRAKGT